MPTLVVGIAGATGSGKSTVAHQLADSVAGEVALLHHDSYYRDRPELDDVERAELNFDHPDSPPIWRTPTKRNQASSS